MLSLTTHVPHQNAPQNGRQIQIIGQCHTSCWFRIILYPYILAYPMIFTQHVWLYILSGNHAWRGNWTSSINGGFMRGNIYKWWIFQQTMFDYQRVPPMGHATRPCPTFHHWHGRQLQQWVHLWPGRHAGKRCMELHLGSTSGIYRLPTDGTPFPYSHKKPQQTLGMGRLWEWGSLGVPSLGVPIIPWIQVGSHQEKKREREIGRHSDESVLDLLTSSLAIYIYLNDLKCVRVCVYVCVYVYIYVCVCIYICN